MSAQTNLGANALAGKKIAVIVESQYIPQEIAIYRARFESYGATVELISRLWGKPTARFYSTVEPGVVDVLEWLEVTTDFKDVEPDDYAAIIVCANYTSVRLRWSDDDVNSDNAPQIAGDAPAVRFFQRAMNNRKIIKGAACHGLWLLTPCHDVLAGRRVICNKVVLADVINAGGIYTPCPPGTPEAEHVIVDGDLVTNDSWHATEALVDAIAELVIASPQT
jgi:putative intracellular protease/amidase